MKTFWIRFQGLLNLRKVTFFGKRIEVNIAWEGGGEFDDSEYYKQAQVTLLLAMKPNPQVVGDRVVVETDLELIPASQRAAEAVLEKLNCEIEPLKDFEVILVESGKI